MPHHHDHSHYHHGHISQNKRILIVSFIIITAFMLVEFAAGYAFNSLALMADAGHMVNDSFSLLLALIALFLSAGKQRWFALANGLSLILVAVFVLQEGLERWRMPSEIIALPMLAVATLGLLVNMLVARLMMKGDHDNLNLRAAYLHVLADLFGSLVAIVAGLSAWLLGWTWVDIVASGLLSLFILKSGVQVIRQVVQGWKEAGKGK